MRLFLALNLPPELRRDIVNATDGLREGAPDLSWVKEPLLHLTLKFLGEQPEEIVDRFREVLPAIGARHREPMVQIGGIGAFPNFRRARVVWLGVEPDPRL